jgi:hypothetical protein
VIAYLTDVEGRWDKVTSFVDRNPWVTLRGDALELADGATFVFGGDAIDRGPHGRRIVRTLLAAKRRYGERVILLAGNRDLNKLRLARELNVRGPRAALLRTILHQTMGAPRAFDHRASELAEEGRPHDDEAVAASYVAEVGPGGELRAYLEVAQLAYREGVTLFVHGGVTAESFAASEVDPWIAELARFYGDELASRDHERLLAYQAPVSGTRLNQASVVYARPTDEHGNPQLPDAATIAKLRASGIERVVVGHTPSGDSPAIVRDAGFELVLGDNSYGRIERGSQLLFDDTETTVHGTAQLDDGARVEVSFTSPRESASPLGRRDPVTGQLVKSQLAGDAFLLFRGLPERGVEQLAVPGVDVRSRRLTAARCS